MPDPGVPSEEELKALPLRAMVAFAARCARRVQPLFNSRDEQFIRAVDTAITVAEDEAAGKMVQRGDRPASRREAGDGSPVSATESTALPYRYC